jgi:hypothetical protein
MEELADSQFLLKMPILIVQAESLDESEQVQKSHFSNSGARSRLLVHIPIRFQFELRHPGEAFIPVIAQPFKPDRISSLGFTAERDIRLHR